MQPATAPHSGSAPPVARGWHIAFAETLGAERERWFEFQPVLLGTGAAIYFALPTEPALLAALLPLALACALWIGTRGMFAVVAGMP